MLFSYYFSLFTILLSLIWDEPFTEADNIVDVVADMTIELNNGRIAAAYL